MQNDMNFTKNEFWIQFLDLEKKKSNLCMKQFVNMRF